MGWFFNSAESKPTGIDAEIAQHKKTLASLEQKSNEARLLADAIRALEAKAKKVALQQTVNEKNAPARVQAKKAQDEAALTQQQMEAARKEKEEKELRAAHQALKNNLKRTPAEDATLKALESKLNKIDHLKAAKPLFFAAQTKAAAEKQAGIAAYEASVDAANKAQKAAAHKKPWSQVIVYHGNAHVTEKNPSLARGEQNRTDIAWLESLLRKNPPMNKIEERTSFFAQEHNKLVAERLAARKPQKAVAPTEEKTAPVLTPTSKL